MLIYINNLYVYPIEIHSKRANASFQVHVQLKNNESIVHDGLPAIYGSYGSDLLISKDSTAVTFKEKS